MVDEKDIFLSYSSKDVEFVGILHSVLEAKGFSIWRDRKDIRSTQRWHIAIHNALKSAKYMILVISQQSMLSKEVDREWTYFLSRKKPIICVWLEDAEINYRLETQQRIDFSSPNTYDKSFDILVNELFILTKNVTEEGLPLDNEIKKPQKENSVYTTWIDVEKHAAAFTDKMLGVSYKEKYNLNHHLQRGKIYQHFENFLDGNKHVMVLTGRAGTGKSSFVCGITEKLRPNTIIWLQNCADLEIERNVSIDSYAGSTLHMPEGVISTFNSLHATDNDKTILLIFDAVNEFVEREWLLGKIAEFVRAIDTPAIKVMVTCRIPVWNNIKRFFTVPTGLEYHTSGVDSYINIDKFEEDEIEEAYNLYKDERAYNLLTPFGELSAQVVHLIKQPFFLRLTAEAYQNSEIPPQIMLKDIFAKYIRKSLGSEGINGLEFQILKRSIELMYEHAQRELRKALLEGDTKLSKYALEAPYNYLVDVGLLSERGEDESLIQKIQMVFITYELVFEYLLAEIIVGVPTASDIVTQLDLAKSKSFVQLRGATELATGFAIVKDRKKYSIIIELAKLNRPDTRQFITDVIHIIHDSGHHDTVIEIVDELIAYDHIMVKLVAAQIGYQLRLDDVLVDLSLSDNSEIRETATTYLYLRWNKARLGGQIEDAYEPIRKIVNMINLMRPVRAKRSLSALVSLSIHIIPHLIEDKQALLPFLEILQNLVKDIPGLNPQASKSQVLKFASDKVLDLVTQIMSMIIGDSIQNSIFGSQEGMDAFFKDHESQRAFYDCCALLDKDGLAGYEDELLQLINWNNYAVYWLVRNPILLFVTQKPEENIPIAQSLFETAHPISFDGKFSIAWAMTYGLIGRILRNQPVSNDWVNLLKDNFIDLWYWYNEIDENYISEVGIQTDHRVKTEAIKLLLYGILNIEAMLQKKEGNVKGSEFIGELIGIPDIALDKYNITIIINTLERISYQGFASFAVISIMDDKFRNIWKHICYDEIIEGLGKIRTFYQEEIDSLLITDKNNSTLWKDLRVMGATPNNSDVLKPAINLWAVAVASEWSFMKAEGNVALALCYSASLNDVIKHTVTILVSSLLDFDVVNINIMQFYKVHESDWDNLERWEIPERCNDPTYKTDVQNMYKKRYSEFVQTKGRGRFHQ